MVLIESSLRLLLNYTNRESVKGNLSIRLKEETYYLIMSKKKLKTIK